MKKSTFDNSPELIVIEGSNVRINFDVTTENVPVSNMEGGESEETREVFKAYVVRFPLPFDIDTILKAVMAEGFDELSARVVATEVILKAIQDNLIPGDELTAAKEFKAAIINAYDNSPAVNSFTIDGKQMWLPRAYREMFEDRLAQETRREHETVKLDLPDAQPGDEPLTLNVAAASVMLTALKDYATDCYDITHAHLRAVFALKTVKKVLDYDHTADYPPTPAFTSPQAGE